MNTICKVALVSAVWATPSWAQTGDNLGIPGQEYRWKMSVAQVKAATPAGEEVEDLGDFGGRRVLQISPLNVGHGFQNQTLPHYVHLWFKNDQLDEFALIPVNEEPDLAHIGRKDSWDFFLNMVVFCQKEFGAPMQVAKLTAIDDIQTRDPKTGTPTKAPLGFKIQQRNWQARGAHYRIAHLFGYKLGLARMQGRIGAPFVGPLTIQHRPDDRAGMATDLFDNFYIQKKNRAPMLSNRRYFQAPNPLRWGTSIYFMDFYWGMTPEEILVAAPDYGIKSIESKKGRSLLLPRLVMESDSKLSWSLQMWFDKGGFREFELRPQQENAGAVLGVADSAAYAKELDRVVAQTYGVPANEWWNVTQQAKTRVKKRYSQTTWVSSPATTYQYAIPVEGGYRYGSTTTSASSYPVTRSYKYFADFPVELPFTIKDRAWTIGKDAHYRQAHLFQSTSGPQLGVVRLQGQRDQQFFSGTGDVVKTKDLKIVLREVYENYGVTPP